MFSYKDSGVSLRVHVPKHWVLEGLALEVVVQALGKYQLLGTWTLRAWVLGKEDLGGGNSRSTGHIWV